MGRRVRIHEDFAADFNRQVAWLVASKRSEWLDRLYHGVAEAAERIARFPEIGTVKEADDLVVVRQIVLRRLPLVAWYGYIRKDPIADVWLLRLFGAGQDRSDAPPRSWKIVD